MTKARPLKYPVCRNCNTETTEQDVVTSENGRTVICPSCEATVAHYPAPQAPTAQVTDFRTF